MVFYPLLSKLAPYFCPSLWLCVSVFAFLTGYVYCLGSHKTYRYSLRKITDLLVSYWSVFFPLAVIAAALGYQYTLKDFLEEMFALYHPTMFFCWYVCFYDCCMLLLPLLSRVMGKNIHIDLFLSLVMVPAVLQLILHDTGSDTVHRMLNNLHSFFPVLLSGFIFARYGLFERLEKLNRRLIPSKPLNLVLWLAAALIVPMGLWAKPVITLRFSALPVIGVTPAININLSVVYAPLFIYSLANLCRAVRPKYLQMGLCHIGTHSLSLWFVSCMFFGNCKSLFQPILYAPHNPIFVTLWGLLLCCIPSAALDFIVQKINRAKNKLFFERRKNHS